MLVPTLPSSKFLVLDNGDLPAVVSLALAAERVAGEQNRTVLVPAWWSTGADQAMPLVHKAVERHASLYDLSRVSAELVVEPAPGSGSMISQLLMAAVPIAIEAGCDAVLFPVRAVEQADAEDPDAPDVTSIAREVDRAALVTRLAALDETQPCPVVTPMVDLGDAAVLDLARDMGVAHELCWWSGVSGDPAIESHAMRWKPRSRASGTIEHRPSPGSSVARSG